jgi:branched-chain amino acid aminotransferase
VPHLRGLPMTQDPKLNSHSKLNCILACIAAQKAGADEALMLDVHGFVNTTNACNFFIVRKGQVWTSTGDYCMNGITRQKVIDLAGPMASRSLNATSRSSIPIRRTRRF